MFLLLLKIFVFFQIVMLKNKIVQFCPECEIKGLRSKILNFQSCRYENKTLFFCVLSEVITIKNI